MGNEDDEIMSSREKTEKVETLTKELQEIKKAHKQKTNLLNSLSKTIRSKDGKIADLENQVQELLKRWAAEQESQDEKQRAEGASRLVELQAENDAIKSKLLNESAARLNLTEDMSKQQLAHEKALAKAQKKADAEINELKDDNQRLHEELACLKKLCETAQETSNQAALELENTQTSERQLKKQSQDQSKQIKSLQEENGRVKAELAKEQDARLNLVERLGQERQAYEVEMEEYCRKASEQMAAMKTTEENLTEELSRVMHRAECLQKSLKHTQEDLDEMQSLNETLKSLNQDQTTQIQHLQGDLAALQEEKAKTRGQLLTAAKKNKIFQKHLLEEKERFSSELSYWQAMNEHLYESVTKKQEQLDKLEAQMKEFKTSNQDQALEIQDLSNQVASLQSDHDNESFALKSQMENLSRQVARLEELKSALTAERDTHRARAEESNCRVEALELAVKNLTVTVSRLRKVEAEKEDLDDTCAELEAQHNDLQKHLEDVLAKISKERLSFQNRYQSLLDDHRKLAKDFDEAQNLAKTNILRVLSAEMSRQKDAVSEASNAVSSLPADLVVEVSPPSEDSSSSVELTFERTASSPSRRHDSSNCDHKDDIESGEERDELASGVVDEEEDGSAISSDEEQDPGLEDASTMLDEMNGAELWFWNMLDGGKGAEPTFSKDESAASGSKSLPSSRQRRQIGVQNLRPNHA